jgi:hypothetical protein
MVAGIAEVRLFRIRSEREAQVSICALGEGAAVWQCFEKVTSSEPSLPALTGGSFILFKMFHLIRCMSGFTLYNVTYDATW